jgi:predicted TIM-barrel fold metal-dependent hydrolase
MADEQAAGPQWDSHVHVFDGAAAVAAGHYRPVHRPLADIEALADENEVNRLVLVQPSVYGNDNAVLLDALRLGQGRHRGVVVLAPDVDDAALAAMHALGVRGVRFNLVSPVGNGLDTLNSFHALAPRLRALGWHVQWYARPEDLPTITALHKTSPVPAVLDHLAGMHAELPPDHGAWQALAQLAALGAWVKLSGWYRLRAASPYLELDASIRKMLVLFEDHLVWGSDWPHTSFAPGAAPSYASTRAPLLRLLSAAQKKQVWEQGPATLYA